MAALVAVKSPEIVAGPLGSGVRESHVDAALRAAGRSNDLQWLFIKGLGSVHFLPSRDRLGTN